MKPEITITSEAACGSTGAPVAILAVRGDISSTSQGAIDTAYGKVDPSIRTILLDLRQVDYINSAGIAGLLRLLLHGQGQRSIVISGLSPHFTKVFTLVGVPRYASLFADRADALRSC